MKNGRLDEKIRRRVKARPKKTEEAAEDKPPELSQKPRGPQLDWSNIKGADFDRKVEPYLPKVGDTDDQIKYLLTLKTDCEYECGKVYRQIQEEERNAPYHPYADVDYRSRHYQGEAHDFLARLDHAVKHLRKRRLIERKPSQSAEVSDESENPKTLKFAECVWVMYYLLEKARIDYAKVDKTEIAKSICLLGKEGYGYENVYKTVVNKRWKGVDRTANDLARVREWFDRLGLTDIVQQIDDEINNLDEVSGDPTDDVG